MREETPEDWPDFFTHVHTLCCRDYLSGGGWLAFCIGLACALLAPPLRATKQAHPKNKQWGGDPKRLTDRNQTRTLEHNQITGSLGPIRPY